MTAIRLISPRARRTDAGVCAARQNAGISADSMAEVRARSERRIASSRFLSTLIATITRPCAPYLRFIALIQGNERRHGPRRTPRNLDHYQQLGRAVVVSSNDI